MVDSGEAVEEGAVLLLAEQAGADGGPQVLQLQAVVHVEVVQGQPRGRDAGGRGSLWGGDTKISEMLKGKIPPHPGACPPPLPPPSLNVSLGESSAGFCAAKSPRGLSAAPESDCTPDTHRLVVPCWGC